MRRVIRTLLSASAVALLAACAESATSTSSLDPEDLQDAFATAPFGYEANVSSFAGLGNPFMPLPKGEGRGKGPGSDFMGGGLGMEFHGGPTDAPGFDRKPPANCVYAASTGVSTCTSTNAGITVVRTIAYKTAAGAPQAKRDSVTHSSVETVDVSGSTTLRDSSRITVSHKSNRTVTGLAFTSTAHTANGTSAGTESSTGKDKQGVAFTSQRTIADTTRGVVTPVSRSADGKRGSTPPAPAFPSAGTVIRTMKATVTKAGATTSSTRREVLTYNGTATATLVITVDGVVRNCTVSANKRPVCP